MRLRKKSQAASAFLIGLLAACAAEAPATGEPQATQIPAAMQDQAATSEIAADAATPEQCLAEVDAALAAEVDAGIRSGFVGMVMRNGEIVHTTSVGMADREAGAPMTPETRFRIASMTKPVTSVAILMLADDGALFLDDPLTKFLPAFADMQVATSTAADDDGEFATEPLKTPITIRHLLTHTAGLGYIFDWETDLGALYSDRDLYSLTGDLSARIETLTALPLYTQPGERWLYSYATDVLGRVIEVASGQSLEDFFEARIFAPLGMSETNFAVSEADLTGAARVYQHTEEGALVRFVGDGGLNLTDSGFGWASGGSGLVSTAADYLKFCRMLIDGGRTPAGERVLSEDQVDALFANHVARSQMPEDWYFPDRGFGLAGWVGVVDVDDPASEPTGVFGWGGYYGTSVAVARGNNVAKVMQGHRAPGPHHKPSKAQDMMMEALFSD